MTQTNAILMKPEDNVATVTEAVDAGGDVVFNRQGTAIALQVLDAIPMGHKFAVRDIAEGETIRKYGEVIGLATRAIPAGRYAHVHNIESCRGRGDKKGT
jgi:altronate dehydratase small subunit